jgi:imidazolonepropionase-like amidohydrolase
MKETCLRHPLQKRRFFVFALLTVFAALPSQAQQTSTTRTQVIHAGKLIDVRTGRVTADAYITLTGERIAAISTSAPAGGAAGERAVIDMSRFTIVPGLIDAHGHILSNPTTQSSGTYLLTSAPQATVRGVSNLQLWLKHGFTVVRDACEPYPSYPQFALREGVEKKLITGPRIVAAGSCVSLTGAILIVCHQTSRL